MVNIQRSFHSKLLNWLDKKEAVMTREVDVSMLCDRSSNIMQLIRLPVEFVTW